MKKCTFLSAKSKFVKTHALNNMHLKSIHGVFQKIIRTVKLSCFFRFQKAGKNNEKKDPILSPFCAWRSPNSQRAHSNPKQEPRRRPFRILEGPKGSELAGHPVYHVFLVFADPVNNLWMKRLFVNVCKIAVF